MFKLHIWHRYVGIVSALFVIILSVTGLLLNFNDELALDDDHVASRWLLEQYSIGDFPVTSFQTEDLLISHASQYLFINGEYVLNTRDALLGAIKTDSYIVLATHSSLLLLSHEGVLIDEIGKLTGLPEAPLGIAKDIQGHTVLRGINTYWKGSSELSAWQPLDGPHPQWVAPAQTSATTNDRIQSYARSHEITLERMLLDLHSGRLFGDIGKNIMSLAAILLLVLAISGTIIWLKKKPS